MDLTIIMPAFNKAKYVAEALDSIFAQKTGYSYGVVIADDGSTDGTLAIAEEYASRRPGIVRILHSDRNQGLYRNVVRAYAEIRTPYFCVLDPDDFWSSDLIVQQALDFLSSHPDFTIYSSNCRVLEPDGRDRPYSQLESEVDSSFGSWLDGRGALGQTSGLFYRNVVFANGLPAFLKGTLRSDQERTFRGDGFRNFIHLHEGKAHFDPRLSATYRITADGLWQGVPELKREVMNVLLFLNVDEYFNHSSPELCTFIGRRLSDLDSRLPRLLATAGDLKAVTESLELLEACRDRFHRECFAAARFAGQLSMRNRLLYGLWRKLNRRAQRKGWTPYA